MLCCFCCCCNPRKCILSIAFLESTHKGGNQRSIYVTQVQQQRPESPKVTLTWNACKYKVHKPPPEVHPACVTPTEVSLFEDVPLAEFIYLVFTGMPGESYRR